MKEIFDTDLHILHRKTNVFPRSPLALEFVIFFIQSNTLHNEILQVQNDQSRQNAI